MKVDNAPLDRNYNILYMICYNQMEKERFNLDNKLFERKVKTLTYQVDGSWFPMSYQDTTNSGSQRIDELLIGYSKSNFQTCWSIGQRRKCSDVI